MVQMRKAQVRLNDNNTRQLQAIMRALNRNPTLKTTLPTLVNCVIDYGLPVFLKSDVYRDATK